MSTVKKTLPNQSTDCAINYVCLRLGSPMEVRTGYGLIPASGKNPISTKILWNKSMYFVFKVFLSFSKGLSLTSPAFLKFSRWFQNGLGASSINLPLRELANARGTYRFFARSAEEKTKATKIKCWE